MPVSDSDLEKSSSSEDGGRKRFFPDDFGKLDMRVGRIINIDLNPYAKKNKPNYVANIDVGEDHTKCVGSELNHFYKKDELLNRLVIVLCNVHPRNKGNLLSEAWLISGRSLEQRLELLDPPQECEPGEQVTVEGYPIIPDIRDAPIPTTSLTKKILQNVRVRVDRVAAYYRVPLRVEGKGLITTQTVADCLVTNSFIKFRYTMDL